MEKIGALWLKDGKNGKFMSGKLDLSKVETSPDETYPILIFKNDRKEGNQPDYQVFLGQSQPKKEDKPDDSEIPF